MCFVPPLHWPGLWSHFYRRNSIIAGKKVRVFGRIGTWISLAINGWALLLVNWANGSGFSCLQTIRWFVKGKESF